MSLYNFVYKLQRKPEKAKRQILIILLVFSFLILAMFWVFMFKNQVSKTTNVAGSSGTSLLGEDQKMLSPFAALIEGFRGFKSDITQKIQIYNQNSVSDSNQVVRPVYELPVD